MATRRIKRRWLLLAATLFAAILVVFVAHHVLRRQITAQLMTALGSEVEIESVSPGIRWHEARRIQLRDKESAVPWLVVERIRFELPLSDVLRGRVTPHQIELNRPEVRVRLDEQGSLIEPTLSAYGMSHLPSPRVRCEQGRVEVQGPGNSTLVLDSIEGSLQETDLGFDATFEVGDSPMGALSGSVRHEQESQALRVDVASGRFDFDTDALPTLPLQRVWNRTLARARGRGILALSLVNQDQHPLQYRVELQLDSVDLVVSQPDLHLQQLAGRLVVENGVATFSDFVARIERGQVSAGGSIDFHEPESTGRMALRLSGIQLPVDVAMEMLPPELTGVLSGQLDLRLTHASEGWSVSGTGSAQIEQGALSDVPLEELHATLDLIQWQRPKREDDAWAHGELQIGWRIVDKDIESLIARLLPDPRQRPASVSGAVSAHGQLQIPLETASDPASYGASVEVTSNGLRVARTLFDEVSAAIRLQDGHLQLQDVVLRLQPHGRLAANAQFAVRDPGDIRLDVVFEQIPAAIAQPYLKEPVPVAGDIAGSLAMVIPRTDWQKPARWELIGTASSDLLNWGPIEVQRLSADVNLRSGRFDLRVSQGQWADAAFEGNMNVAVHPPYEFNAHLRSSRVALDKAWQATGHDAPRQITGMAEAEGHLSGTLEPLSWRSDGQIALDELKLADLSARQFILPWNMDTTKLEIRDATAKMLGGTVSLTATFPWRDMAASHLEGSFESWDMGQLNERIGVKAFAFGGNGSGRFSADNLLSPDQLSGELSFSDVDAKIRNINCRELTGRLGMHNGAVSVQVNGGMLGGTCAFQGQAQLAAPEWQLRALTGKAQLRQVQLQQLWPAIGQQQRFGLLHAVGNAEWKVQLDDLQTCPTVQGTVSLTDARWGSTSLASDLTADVELTDAYLRIREARLSAGRGKVVGSALVNTSNRQGEFRLQIDEVPLRWLLGSLPAWARKAHGAVNGEMAGRLGDQWDASGVLRLDRGSLAAIPLSAVRVPLRVTHVPESGRTSVDLELQSARIASGRAQRCVQAVLERPAQYERLGRNKRGQSATDRQVTAWSE